MGPHRNFRMPFREKKKKKSGLSIFVCSIARQTPMFIEPVLRLVGLVSECCD